nr:PREDICTED: protein-lysine N-methyltransferase EEF2KMT isoform X2 [Latimeria chalumnae]|eukprot:XP_014346319.1 PREDICTED: protein-lysine N-methyltransferase EEF2KMT isoform X2 [Latimeria chalumnae]
MKKTLVQSWLKPSKTKEATDTEEQESDRYRKIQQAGVDRDFFHCFQVNFFAMSRLGCFPWTELEEKLKSSEGSSVLQTLLQKTVLHPLCGKYPPSEKYRRLFLLELIKKEATATEPLDELYDELADVLNTEESKVCHKSYFLPSDSYVTLCESVAIISEGTTGLVTWEGALYLAEWAMENPTLFSNRSVLELGSGIGLTGLVLCKMCQPERYIFSDHHPNVIQQLRKNVLLNGFCSDSDSGYESNTELRVCKTDSATAQRPEVSIVGLDWTAVTEEELSELQADVVIAADVVYDPEIVPCLIDVLQRLTLLRKGAVTDIYIASTIRNKETYQLFKAKLETAKLKQQIIPGPTTRVFPYVGSSNIEILKICQCGEEIHNAKNLGIQGVKNHKNPRATAIR